MERQAGACCWYAEGVFKAQANIDADMKRANRRQMVKLNADREQLRQAVVKPEGYRTFATCRFRLPAVPNSRPCTPNSSPPPPPPAHYSDIQAIRTPLVVPRSVSVFLN